jgi:hypothetical protein
MQVDEREVRIAIRLLDLEDEGADLLVDRERQLAGPAVLETQRDRPRARTQTGIEPAAEHRVADTVLGGRSVDRKIRAPELAGLAIVDDHRQAWLRDVGSELDRDIERQVFAIGGTRARRAGRTERSRGDAAFAI